MARKRRAGEVVCRCDGYTFPHRATCLWCCSADERTVARRDYEDRLAQLRGMFASKREHLQRLERGESDIGSGGRVYSSTGNRMGRY